MFFVSMIIEIMVCISHVYCNVVRNPLWTEGVHACRCSIDRRSAAPQTRRFWWLSAVSADAAGQTRRGER
jgi:hypothetical protein